MTTTTEVTTNAMPGYSDRNGRVYCGFCTPMIVPLGWVPFTGPYVQKCSGCGCGVVRDSR